jgi:hypothetical protein
VAFLLSRMLRPRQLQWLAIACAACAQSCSASPSLAHVDVWLESCSAGGSSACGAQAQTREPGATNEHFTVQAFFDPEVSRYAPHGLYAYFELPRADGSTGILELDVATDGASGQAVDTYQASYRELAGDTVRFETRKAQGSLVVPKAWLDDKAAACACNDGGFELRFSDAGADRVADTADDQVRTLSFGRFGHDDTFCRAPLSAPMDGALHVTVESCTPPVEEPSAEPVSQPEPARDPLPPPEPRCVNCYASAPIIAGTTDDGCSSSRDDGGGGCDDSSSSGSGGGCDGSSGNSTSPSSSDSSPSSSSDSSSSSSDSSGCEGDTADDHSSCAAVRAPSHSRSRHRSSSFLGTGLPLVLLCLSLRLRSQRLWRSAQRVSSSSTMSAV